MTKETGKTKMIPVVVCTDRRGVIFGYAAKVTMPKIRLENARFCLYWSAGGVGGLAEHGPVAADRIGATIPVMHIPDAHAVMETTDAAADAWRKVPTYV